MSELVDASGQPVSTKDTENGPQLKVYLHQSVVTGLPVGVAIQLGEGQPFIANPDQAENLAVGLIRSATTIRLAAQSYMQNAAERAMAEVDPSKLRA